MKVLIVEDDMRIAHPLKEDLEQQCFRVDIAADGEKGWELYSRTAYDLVLLDWMLPALSGAELCRRMRHHGFGGAIMMLTARGEKQDKIMGLDCGADDYVVKPFDVDELGARIRAILRRSNSGMLNLNVGNLSIDVRGCTASYADKTLDLTPTEYRLLLQFVRNPKVTFSKRDLVEKLWSFDDTPSEAVIKTHIKCLRQKLQSAGCKKEIVSTVYGFGYRLNESI